MVTAVGSSGPAAAAALRAGIHGIRRGNLWDPAAMEYIPAGRPVMPQWWEGRDMLAELAAPAIAECTTAAENMFHVPAGAVPVVVLLPPPDRPCRWPQLEAAILDDLARKLGRPLAHGSAVVAEGRTGFVRALAIASDLAYGARMGCVI